MKATPVPGEMPTTSGGDTLQSGSGPARSERELSSSDVTFHTEEGGDPYQTIPMEVYTPQPEGGSSRSWSDRVEDEETWGQQSSRHHK